jgi:hypothetical protein
MAIIKCPDFSTKSVENILVAGIFLMWRSHMRMHFFLVQEVFTIPKLDRRD